MTNNEHEPAGLTNKQARERQHAYGKNELAADHKPPFFAKALHILGEPMFMLLMVAAIVYFVLGEPGDGLIMLVFVIGIMGIDLVQEWKTDKTLNALKELSAPLVDVLRDGKKTQIASIDLVPGDIMMIHEGVKIPADGIVIKCSDLCVDESSLTGEAEGIWKVSAENADAVPSYWRKDYCYAGTLVIQGFAVVCVEQIGQSTTYGKIGTHVAAAPEEHTPLQKQTDRLIKQCAGIAAILFAFVGVATWLNIPDHSFQDRLVESILSGVVLAMAMIPEEFPVILTVFLSMGAWRLAKKNSLVRRLPSVETLGAISVLCVDKTGTITVNQMTVQEAWPMQGDEQALCEVMGLACETDAYDPMEKAMLDHCEGLGIARAHLFGGELMAEYAFTRELKMMGHVWRHEGEILLAAKGSPEQLLPLCALTEEQQDLADAKIYEMGEGGLRVIAVATARFFGEADIPPSLTDCSPTLCGLIGLADLPRASVANDIRVCKEAGIRVVMITGDNGITAASIAKKIGMQDYNHIITGDELDNMSDDELRKRAKTIGIFSRAIPEHKMRIVKAFQANGDIVAMTGDGVNDAPALKHADIGIAMGKRGSQVSREAADLVLMDDNFSTIVETVRDGRRIYDNMRKAMGYVLAIHIPIALTSILAPMMGIAPADLMLLPLHVVLLELIIDPTCSIVLECQPAEADIMERGPRDRGQRLLDPRTMLWSILQGLTVFAASFGAYAYGLVQNAYSAPAARSMGLMVLMLANVFLVQINSSQTEPLVLSLKRMASDRVIRVATLLTLFSIPIALYTPLSDFLKLAPLSAGQFLSALGLAALSVLWYELVKFKRRH